MVINETHLHWKMHFGTETSDLNSEGGLNFEWSIYRGFYCICYCWQSQEMSSPLLTQTVRKDLAMAIRDLIQHGLVEVTSLLYIVVYNFYDSLIDKKFTSILIVVSWRRSLFDWYWLRIKYSAVWHVVLHSSLVYLVF